MQTVLTPPKAVALTTVEAVRGELKLTTEEHDPRLEALILDATAGIAAYLDRPAARQKVRRNVAGYGDAVLQLPDPPIVQVAVVTYRGEVVLDYELADAEAGQLYRERGWDWTAATAGLLTASPVPGTERPDWGIEYWRGWLLPDDDYKAPTISADAADNSLNDSAAAFPLVVPGEWITLAGFTEEANNGQARVLSRTDSKIVLAAKAVVTEAADDAKPITLTVRTLPRDIERAAIETATGWYRAQGRDPGVASKRVADVTVAYRDGVDASGAASVTLPPRALALLAPWRRYA